MSEPRFTLKFLVITTLITIVITVTVLAGFFKQHLSSENATASTASSAQPDSPKKDVRKIIYWKAPMDPMEIYDEPGKSKMGMDLVPVYEDEVADNDNNKNQERKIIYWKAPMDPTEIYDQPGQSKMGMDLVPVYEDELVSGVDIKIDPVVEQNMGLKTERVKKGRVHHTIETYGNITYDETRTGIVSLKVSGWIEKLHADYTGFHVKKGDPLYEVYSPALLTAQAEYLIAYKTYRKNKSAMNKEIMQSARKRLVYFDIADSEIKTLEKTGKAEKTLLVRSPVSGVITHKNIDQGSYVKSGASLYTISDLQHLWVEAHIFEYEQNLVSVGQQAQMTLSNRPDKVYTGKVAYIYPYLQPRARDIIIRIHLDNKDLELKPDMFANIKITTVLDKPLLSVSSQSVIHSGRKKLVFIQKDTGKFSPREITTGLHLDDGMVQIVSGLAEGERVVTSGQFLLDSESKMKEAIQKMLKAKSKPATLKKNSDKEDFFDDMDPDMEPKDNFFDDMGYLTKYHEFLT